ncbi:hypothetical protein GPECTOR_208g400 [Gonium pectorale]|uniref:Uncharacterized protein n=1 Tax=Gonium pectorale TaxID=33097 RepID=A0A150FWY3_GONPE|nr:hypothetical protein GPECTOR_208g400 [Gonium pectorale]|eukprot:KXZ42088.1 hypothetical protein GPECTOR_208g400 [Gonium pectorale]
MLLLVAGVLYFLLLTNGQVRPVGLTSGASGSASLTAAAAATTAAAAAGRVAAAADTAAPNITAAAPDAGPVSKVRQGVDPAAIRKVQPLFHGARGPHGGAPRPKQYSEWDEPLPYGAVRILALPLNGSQAVLDIAASVTADVVGLLPPGTQVFANGPGSYHCTVFHTSQPTDPRPDPSRPDGGLDDPSLPPPRRRPQTAAEWERELATVRRIVAATPVPTLRLERVLQASSGVLLLTWTEAGEARVIPDLRRRLREAFPGASTKQASIIHSSLLRIVLWFVREAEFSTVVGEREIIRLADGAGADGAGAADAAVGHS